ncbi:phosphoenolpyruvate--protein phosphotransferase [Caproiciproducens sp.]|uniref:phosphoenolpyruvate--protein phosphotransferase n=1 Tax=Caproiciproducens sp. TaxID=1954376 RepID=UPI0028A18694|nr:phosphoenolpyruvate--protein phosphotransferase [Caproiciproducens sp.]
MNYHGNPVSRGIAAGPVFLYQPFTAAVSDIQIEENAVGRAIGDYEAARHNACNELETIRARLAASDLEKAKIFTAHIDILFDEAMDGDIRELIEQERCSPDRAIDEVYEKYAKILGKSPDPLIKERASDIRDVKTRLIRVWNGVPEKNLSSLPSPAVIVVHDLLPSDTATLDRENVLAIVTEIGGSTSHSAIIARSYGIPAILGVEKAMERFTQGETVIVDALTGEVITRPTEQQLADCAEKRRQFAARQTQLHAFMEKEAVTPDGVRVDIELNLASVGEQELEGSKCTDGVGLFRTEFLYLGRDTLPTEDEQFEIYRMVLTKFGNRPVTLRTLDVGGDKKLDCLNLPHEENPFLGNRALRLCFDRPGIFRTQLRAALRASVYGNLWIMFPMVGSMDDIRHAKQVVSDVKEELTAEGVSFSPDVKIGIMIEIPSIALMADFAAQEVDFASIGTNDLCQYTMAVDRLNPAVSRYYQSYSPALFRLVKHAADMFIKNSKPICVCGELGGDRLGAAVLIGLGVRKLSMSISSVAQTRKLVNELPMKKAEEIAAKALSLSTAQEVEQYLNDSLKDILA